MSEQKEQEVDVLKELLPIAKIASYKSFQGKGKRIGKFVVIVGASDTGKTYFISSAPDPTVIIDMDDGTEAIGTQWDEELQEEYNGIFPEKDIRVIHVDMDTSLDPKDNKVKDKNADFSTSLVNAMQRLKKTISTVEKALEAGAPIRTVAFETASWLWMGAQDWMKYKILDMGDVKGYVEQTFDWAIAQKEYRRIFMRLKRLRKYGCNVIITAHTKNTYNNKMEVTGEEIHWWHQSVKLADTILWIHSKPKKIGKRVITQRNTKFHRLRSVDNAKNIAKVIEDITWDKFIKEMSRIRLVGAEKKVAEEKDTKYTVDEKSEGDKSPKKKRPRATIIEN